MAKKALITGVTGQDGSYLSELLIEQGYEVHGTIRRISVYDPSLLASEYVPWSCDVRDYRQVDNLITLLKPDEIYHLAAQSYVQDSFEDPYCTMQTNVEGTHNVLSAAMKIRTKVYFAASSEMYGNAQVSPQTEKTPMRPVSPYGISKLTAFHLCQYYRRTHGLPVSCGIAFNHESPRRGGEFVTQKIARYVAAGNFDKPLRLGNLDASRDWGHAKDYVYGMWLMLQNDPDDYVLATNSMHSISEFCRLAFACKDLEWDEHVISDPTLKRPIEVHTLMGDYTKAYKELEWRPTYSFEELVLEMVA